MIKTIAVVLCMAGVSQPVFSTENNISCAERDNPYINSDVQSYVETAYGYMKPSKKPADFPENSGKTGFAGKTDIAAVSQSGPRVSFSPIRDIIKERASNPKTEISEATDPALYKLEASAAGADAYPINETAAPAPVPPAYMNHEAGKEKILDALNSVPAPVPGPLLFHKPANLAGMDYKVRFAGTPGAMAKFVPPLEEPGYGYIHKDYLFVSVTAMRKDCGDAARRLSRETGFISMVPAGINKKNTEFSGWVPADNWRLSKRSCSKE